jgi:hypothetical protein
MITSYPSIAILIDCWETKWNEHAKTCFDNIINILDDTESITTVVLATYNCKSERYTTNSIWAQNNVMMCENSTRKKIHCMKDAYDHLYMYDNNKNHKLEQTDPTIWNYINPTKYQISMHWWWELEYYLSLHPEIKNIYFLGISWEQCVRTRPLGYEAVFEEAPHFNILTNSKCVLSEVHSDPINIENNVNWKSIGNDIYHYQPISRSI